ncbi:hypothetical protein P7H62_14370 [Vagococcus carniphilus]|uniref:hypothetical protein n=1 Tax=Vagococcus carniphilus TaxID=218144 RepID=UPI0028923205|nr:hypothetical protein [Vagococcus carniphilus]MDT2830051.1 hypothetical protein [Vagococcus carniphilus]MDT2838485.1 hypothetical protein [Vagococcus carniphilus]MDT2855647.1 hypothetical protein [Vagococcus carniphilus]
MDELYQEIREFSKELKKQTEIKFEGKKINSRERYLRFRELEKQDKEYGVDLELENFYLAVKLLLMKID